MHEDFRNYVEELLANQPCPIDTWIHLQSCPQRSQELEALRKVSGLFSRGPQDQPEPDPFFYAWVQVRIAHLRLPSPWCVFLDSSFAKCLVLTCLACIRLLAAYLFSSSSEEYKAPAAFRAAHFTSLEPSDPSAQRDAVLVNFAVDSRPVDDVPR
jgi:hypothetical protein